MEIIKPFSEFLSSVFGIKPALKISKSRIPRRGRN
jgi:hypothetical protein